MKGTARCPVCGKLFAGKRGVKDHAKAKHPKIIKNIVTKAIFKGHIKS